MTIQDLRTIIALLDARMGPSRANTIEVMAQTKEGADSLEAIRDQIEAEEGSAILSLEPEAASLVRVDSGLTILTLMTGNHQPSDLNDGEEVIWGSIQEEEA